MTDVPDLSHATSYLLDANVLIALAIVEHEHHDRVTRWASHGERLALCPITEGALVRTLVRLGERAQTARLLLQGFYDSGRCEFWTGSVSYADLDLGTLRGHRQATDAYLAGLADARGALLATLDEGLALAHPASILLLPA
ncbi:MAG: PIN domain-containing protein [Micrococcus sp.]|nr:PIN domain-containing protein [Micrococcus sp.]